MENEPRSDADDSWLLHQWIVAGVVSASARFIPVPFVDDIVRKQCRRFVISRTIAENRSPVSTDDLRALFDDNSGCLGGCVGTIAKAPLKLLLFPIRKVMSIVTSVRGVPIEIIRMVLLGRTIDRYAKLGKLNEQDSSATTLRLAFDDAFARMDFRVVQATIGDALRAAKGWKASATSDATEIARRQSLDSDSLSSTDGVNRSADKIQTAINHPTITELFADFDRRLDQSLALNETKRNSDRIS